MPAATQFREERAELDAVLSSGIFARSPSLANFLQYVCEKYFEGQSGTIKEYNVAVEALGRSPSFDQKKDSIVRVEAHRLRKRLQEYYRELGAGHSIQISIPPGNYVPQFVHKEDAQQPLTSIVESTAVNGQEQVALQVAGLPPPVLDAEPVLPPSHKPGWRLILTFIAVALLVGGIATVRSRASKAEPHRPVPVPAIPLGEEVRIMAGSAAASLVDHYGQTWHGDQFYHGGNTLTVSSRPIAKSQDPALYLTRREGDFSYDIPAKPGTYEVHLYFAETMFGENNIAAGGESTRLFNVRINGIMSLFYFDVVSDAGGSNTADVKIFKDVKPAADGKIHIAFVSTNKESPFVNAIEVLPSTPGFMRPVRIVARDISYADKTNLHWSADRYFTNGMMLRRHDPIANTEDDELYRSERYGNFTYTIPVVDNTRFTLTLKFCESWFGPGRPGGGGADSRIFDVYANGRTLLRNFDLFKEAGGSLRAIDKTFKGLEPNAQGKIVLQFVPDRNYALINGIEVLDEGT